MPSAMHDESGERRRKIIALSNGMIKKLFDMVVSQRARNFT